MLGVLRHAGLRRHGVLAPSLNVALVCKCRRRVDWANIRHVTGGHVRVLRHWSTLLLLLHVAVGWLLGRFDLIGVIDTVLVALARLRRVQACLCATRLALRTSCNDVQHLPESSSFPRPW